MQVFERAALSKLIVLSAFALSCIGLFDLTIERLTVPASVRPGDDFVTSSQVCNRGDEAIFGDVLEFWIRDAVSGGNDIPIGSRPVPYLEAGQCHSEVTTLAAPVGPADGPYQLIGRLYAGGHEQKSAVFGIGHQPDLVVETLEGPPSVGSWSPFEVTARVCNQGTEWAPNSDLSLYLSEDMSWAIAPPAPPGSLVGSLGVPSLPPGACETIQGSADAQVSGDRHYVLGAWIDEAAVVPELIEDNNRGVTLMGVGWLSDLIVQSLAAPHSIWNGESFEAQGVVCNQGTSPSPPTDLTFFFSEDNVIAPPAPPDPTSGDLWLGMAGVPPLSPGECQLAAALLDGGVPLDGEWTLGAAVDLGEWVDELIEFNNIHSGPKIGVGDGADLVVEQITAPPSVGHGNSFAVEVELCNRGTSPSDPSHLLVYLSADTELDEMPLGSDPEVGFGLVGPVIPDACVDLTVDAHADLSISGAARVFARADGFSEVAELIESNNDRLGPWIGVGFGPDLIARSLSAPPSVQSGEEFDVELELCNQGTTPSPPTSVVLYHSSDQNLSSGSGPGADAWVGEIVLTDSLMADTCVRLSGGATADGSFTGARFLGAAVDEFELVEELQEANNHFIGPLMGVGYGPDLVVASLDAPPSATPDGPLPIDFQVCNRGTAMSAPALVAFYDSDDSLIVGGPLPGSDRWLGDETVPDLPPGACHWGAAVAWLPSGDLGERHLGAIVDEPNWVEELVEANNAFVGPILGVGHGPDLWVTSLRAPASVAMYSPLSIDTQVCNQGTDPSDPAYLTLYLSSDAEIEGSYFDPAGGDPWLGDVPVPSLAPGACHDEVVDGWPDVPHDGAWHLGAIVDEGMHVDELVESNNTKLGPLVGVGDGPDLVVVGLDVPTSAELGPPFSFSVDVCNDGTLPSPLAYATLLHSEDSVIASTFPGPPGPDVPFANVAVDPLLPGECRSIPGMGSAAVADGGPWIAAAVVDEQMTVPELIETNNVFVGSTMGLGTGPDLVVTTLDAPTGLPIGAGFVANVAVCNHGTVMSPPSLAVLYHSADDQLAGPPFLDTWLADLGVPALVPGACHAELKSVAPGVPGAGYLAAVVDEGDAIAELIESNNDRLELLDVIEGP